MQFLAPAPDGGDEVCPFQNAEMLRHCLASHIPTLTKFVQRLPVLRMQPVQQVAPDRVGKRVKDRIHAHADNMQPFSCILQAKIRFAAVTVIGKTTREFDEPLANLCMMSWVPAFEQ